MMSSECALDTPALPTLLRFIPAEGLATLASCRRSLQVSVWTDEVWARCIVEVFGGSVSDARRLLPSLLEASPRDLFLGLVKLRRAVRRVEVVTGSLADAQQWGVDAVVCPAVPNLGAYGPAARAVYAKAGDELSEHIESLGLENEPLQVGQVQWTPGFGLGVSHLVHAVGPTLRTLDGDSLLRQTYAAAVDLIVERGAQSVAFGSISTGGNGFSVRLAAQIAAEVFRDKLVHNPGLRFVVVAYDADVRAEFESALRRLAGHVNLNLLEKLPLIILDSMLPGQRLTFAPAQFGFALPPDCERFVMVGSGPSRREVILPRGVEAKVLRREGNSDRIEVVAMRRCAISGRIQQVREYRAGLHDFAASVEWISDNEEQVCFGLEVGCQVRIVGLTKAADLNNSMGTCLDFIPDSGRWGVRLQNGQRKSIRPENLVTANEEEYLETVGQSVELGPLVSRWLELVRAGHERQPGQMDMILDHLGPMPPAKDVTARAIWVAALVNPLPVLGVAMEMRPAMLMANTMKERVSIAREGILRSISHLDGSRKLGT